MRRIIIQIFLWNRILERNIERALARISALNLVVRQQQQGAGQTPAKGEANGSDDDGDINDIDGQQSRLGYIGRRVR